MDPKKPVIIILGPTASGKTALAVHVANRINGEIISADSRQVYQGMDIGSGKDLSEYGSIPYHLIDIRDAGAEYSVSDFQTDAMSALSDISSRGLIPIICGGTGHYVKSLLDEYHFSHSKTDHPYTSRLESLPRKELFTMIKNLGLWNDHHWESDSRRRMARAIEKQTRGENKISFSPAFNDLYQSFCYFIQTERPSLIQKIETRLTRRLETGLIEEVEQLLDMGVTHHRLQRYGLEYRWVSRYVAGEIDYETLFERLSVDIRRYAKRQMTFIRYLQKKGHRIEAISDPTSFPEQIASLITATNS